MGLAAVKVEHLGLGYLTACLRRDGHAVEILDAQLSGLDTSQVTARLADADHDLVGFTIPDTLTVKAAVQFLSEWRPVARNGKRPHVTAGGNFATVHAKALLERLPALDSVVLHEGEETLCELVGRLAAGEDWQATPGLAFSADGGVSESEKRPRIADLDALPFPARDTLSDLLASHPNPVASVISSRGCHRRCRFCAVQKLVGSWRARSAANVVDELASLRREFGVERVDFQDDNFVGPGERGRRRAIAIAREIQRRRLELSFRLMCSADTVSHDVISALLDAGLLSVFIGVESGSQARLTAYAKGTVEQNAHALRVLEGLGILDKCEIGFIMFDPDGDLAEINDNLAFLRDHVRFVTPSNLINKRDALYEMADFTWHEMPPVRALPESLRLLRNLFMLVLKRSRLAWQNVCVRDPQRAREWTAGAIDIASQAVTSLSELIESGRLDSDSYRGLAEEVELQAVALSEAIVARSQT
jgi:radical SAM superfamily enzyme YgiQ (UPF0313 family)